MAICGINTGITSACGEYSMAGVSNIYLANRNEITSFDKNATGEVTGITMAGAYDWYEYEFGEDTAFFTQPFQNTNGNIAYTASIEFRIPNQDQSTINALSQLDFAKVAVIVKARNGKQFLFGETNPMKRTGGENSSGTAATDASGVQIILTGGGPGPACIVVDGVIDALLA